MGAYRGGLLQALPFITMENRTLSYIALGLAVIAVATVFFTHNPQGAGSSNAAFNKVISSGTVRVGYAAYPPYIIKDPNTGELSGVFYDLTNVLANQLGMKVEWVEAGAYGTIFSDLSSGRYDIYGGGIWPNSTRAKAGYFTDAAFYNAVYAYARTNDHRFDNNLAAINGKSVRISTLDGEVGQAVAKTDYPDAQEVSLPQTAPFDQIALQVISNKADVAFLQPDAAGNFQKANPNTLRQVSGQPIRLFGNTYAVNLGETSLQQMFNVALQEAVSSGAVEKILAKYQPNYYLLPAPSYTK